MPPSEASKLAAVDGWQAFAVAPGSVKTLKTLRQPRPLEKVSAAATAPALRRRRMQHEAAGSSKSPGTGGGGSSATAAAVAALAATAFKRHNRRAGTTATRAAGSAEEEEDDFDSMDLVDMLIQQSRQTTEFGMSTIEYDSDVYDDPPPGYAVALQQGIDLTLARAGNDAKQLAHAAPDGTSPRFLMMLTPRPTLGLGWLLNKELAANWAVSGPLKSTIDGLRTPAVETLVLHSSGSGLWFPPWTYEGVANAYRQGLCTRVGISTEGRQVKMRDIQRASEALSARGLTLSCVFVRLSLLEQENLPVVEECRRLGIQVFAEQALGDDNLASGRYTAANPTAGEITIPKFTLEELRRLEPLVLALQDVALRAQMRCELKEIDTTQVALQWVRSKGASPLCDVETEVNALALAMCKQWELAQDEIAILDKAAAETQARRRR